MDPINTDATICRGPRRYQAFYKRRCHASCEQTALLLAVLQVEYQSHVTQEQTEPEASQRLA